MTCCMTRCLTDRKTDTLPAPTARYKVFPADIAHADAGLPGRRTQHAARAYCSLSIRRSPYRTVSRL